ncbi:polysaccharide deacetylase family protein [Natrinema sp. SYSU A 869]|uniref:polysaccharide deacetylase family protein n=1 Tax=Natrinema sp. SYSU A 869 TaxID=2871694 RepID=UPI00210504FB|nr:polysaccharide deacetylase family protein [Natrinema sp. SYSU A 869]
MKRRTYLGVAAAAVLAGCSSTEEAEDESPENGSSEAGTDDEAESGDGARANAFDDFENLDEWEERIGSLSADADRSYTGSQSARLEAEDGDDQVRIVRELSEPRDLSGTRPGLAMATEEEADVVVQVIDEDGDRLEFRQRTHAGTPLVQCNFGISDIDGDPDLSAVSEIQLLRWTGEDDKGSVWVDDLQFVDAPETGQVMLQFDGGYESDYTRALPILEEYDYPAVSFIMTGRIRDDDGDEGDHLVRDQLTALADAGWTIGSHSAHGADLTNLSADRDPETEVGDAVEWLEDEGSKRAHSTSRTRTVGTTGTCSRPSRRTTTSRSPVAIRPRGPPRTRTSARGLPVSTPTRRVRYSNSPPKWAASRRLPSVNSMTTPSRYSRRRSVISTSSNRPANSR